MTKKQRAGIVQRQKMFAAIGAIAFLTTSGAWSWQSAVPVAAAQTAAAAAELAVGPQYDTSHVYVGPDLFDGFVTSLLGTFGTATKQGVFAVTPTPSSTMSQLCRLP